MFTTFLKMPLWWLVWAPFAFVTGLLLSTRPRFFESDECCNDSGGLFDAWVRYQHWPVIAGKRLIPLIPIAIGTVSWTLYLIIRKTSITILGGHSLLLWLCLAAGGVILIFFVIALLLLGKEKVQEAEWYQMTRDSWKERKKGMCPSYKVVD